MLPIRLAFPTCPRARWSELTQAHRPATTVANGAPLAADMPARIGLQLWRASFANQPMTTLLWSVSAVMYPVFLLGHRFGAFPAPDGTRSSASRSAPLRGLGSSQNKFAKGVTKRRANLFRAPPRKQTFGLGSRAHSLGFALCDPSNNGNFNKRRHDYVPISYVELGRFC